MEDYIQTPEEQIEILEAKLEMAERTISRYADRDAMYQDLIKQANLANLNSDMSEESRAKLIATVRDTYVKGKHMAVLEGAIKDNELVADAWKKFMVALRLTGYDEPLKDQNPNA